MLELSSHLHSQPYTPFERALGKLNLIMQQMMEKEDADFIEGPSSESPHQLQFALLTRNTILFKRILKASLRVGLCRLLIFPIIFIFQEQFLIINSKQGLPDSWSIIFYVIACMMDFMVILNDTTMMKLLAKDRDKLEKVKEDLKNRGDTQVTTNIGPYQSYLSIYDILESYKYKNSPSVSISETVRCLHMVMTFYIFGNLAVSSENYTDGQTFKVIFLWLFILSIYLSVFELDNAIMENSSGTFVEAKPIQPQKTEDSQQSEELSHKNIKHRYIKNCRRPFEIIYIISILSMLFYTVAFFRLSLLNLFMLICTATHAVEVLHQKHLQNKLIDVDFNSMCFKYLDPFKIVDKLSRSNKKLYISIRVYQINLLRATRVSIILAIMAYFRDANTPLIQSVLFLVINVFLFLGQYAKFNQLGGTKLYVLEAFPFESSLDTSDTECSICLLKCLSEEAVIQLPCFSGHVYHHPCMKKWFQQRKQCPLCRCSLEAYDLQ